MRYFETVVSRPGHGVLQYIAVGYVEDMQFMRFDRDAENQRYELRVPWMEQEGPDYWERVTQTAKDTVKSFPVSLRNMLLYYNQSKGSE